MFDPKDIDPFLLDLITELNEKGYPTCACCQGRRTFAEFSPSMRLHCPEAYIYTFPLRFVSNAKVEGLYVYGGSDNIVGIASICVYVLPVAGDEIAGYVETRKGTLIEKWKYEDKLKVIEANWLFVERVRRACGFSLKRKDISS